MQQLNAMEILAAGNETICRSKPHLLSRTGRLLYMPFVASDVFSTGKDGPSAHTPCTTAGLFKDPAVSLYFLILPYSLLPPGLSEFFFCFFPSLSVLGIQECFIRRFQLFVLEQ